MEEEDNTSTPIMASTLAASEAAQMMITSVDETAATQVVVLPSNPGETPDPSILLSDVARPHADEASVVPDEAENSKNLMYQYAVENSDSQTALLDMNQFMDVVYSYNCKFCTFTTKSPDDMGDHVLSVHIERPMTENPTPELIALQEADDTLIHSDHMYTVVESEELGSTEAQLGSSESDTLVSGENLVQTDSIITHMDNNIGVNDVEDIAQFETAELEKAAALADSQNSSSENAAIVTEIKSNIPIMNIASVNKIDLAETEAAVTIVQQGNTMGGNAEEATQSTFQEIFMCGQCTLSFINIQQCKEHMFEEHNINLLTELETEEHVSVQESISATVHEPDSKKISIGTQAIRWKKPGRKRKQPEPDTNEQVDDLAGVGVNMDIKKEVEDEPLEHVEMPVFSEKFLSGREKSGKRRIKIPKILQDDYCISKSQDFKSYSGNNVASNQLEMKRSKSNIVKFELKCKVPACKAKFHLQSSLDEHVKCHNRTDGSKINKGFTCTLCPFTSIQWSSCRLHLWMKHAVNLDLLTCDKCEYHTDAHHKLVIHSQIHDEEKRYSCEFCDKAFKQLSQLIHHSKLHLTDAGARRRVKLFQSRQCHICNRVLMDSKSLKNHIQFVHDKVKQYSCDYCGHTAARKHMLLTHMRTHTGERPHKCDLCTFATSDHNTLRRHRRRHTGEKPYKCKYCPYACIQAISLKIHMKNKHRDCDGLFYCHICHYHTVNEKNWNQHQEDHKNGLIEEQVKQKDTYYHCYGCNYHTDNEKGWKKHQDIHNKGLIEEQPDRNLLPENGQMKKESAISIQQMIQNLNIPTKLNPSSTTVQVATNEPVVQEVLDVREIQADDLATANGSNIRLVYYAVGDNEEKEQLVLAESFLVQDKEQSQGVITLKPSIQTVQLIEDPGEGSLSLTIEQSQDGAPKVILAPMSESVKPILEMKPSMLEGEGKVPERMEGADENAVSSESLREITESMKVDDEDKQIDEV